METWPTSGMTRRGLAYAPATSAPHTTGTGCSSPRLLATPTASLALGGGSQHPDIRKAGGHQPSLADQVVHLLPTPRASDGTKGSPGQRASSGDLTVSSAVALLPTPTAARSGSNGAQRADADRRPSLDAIGRLLPTPTAADARGSRNATANRSTSGHHTGQTLMDVFWTGDRTRTRSGAGKRSSTTRPRGRRRRARAAARSSTLHCPSG
ncbi:hypothetical protein [Prauserella cavernicola]|uniref:hypothetical protein n=1 Tax=Prauserella cavernicola TaxID=2800127 RepID=UPI001E4EF6E2|nr:hypothetical protein [Prauserella cavernicola]